jgi:Leucine-rich repeat (LRR) protein
MSKKVRDKEPQMATLEPVSPSVRRSSSFGSRSLVVLLCLIIAVLIALLLRPVKLDVYKTIDELEFADVSLATCVKETARMHGWTDVGHIVTLRCNHPSGEPVKSLDGIEHLVSLTDVNLAFNAIIDAAPLAHLPRLTVIDLSHNHLHDLPVFRSAYNLARLELNYNQFESLNWLTTQHFSVLSSLSVAHNNLDTLDAVGAVMQLRELNVRNNRITDIGPAFNLTALELIDLGSNMVSSIQGISALKELRRAFLDRNNLTHVADLADLKWLEELDLSSNPLGEVSDLGALQRLQRLDLSQTGIRSLKGVLSLGDLEVLRLHGNDELACDEIAIAIREFDGDATVRYDGDCTRGS